MAKTYKYYIIGGQYESHCYGGAATLTGAKRIATKNAEYWDNWQGWHKPRIYRAEDTEIIISRGRITTPDGVEIRIQKWDADPIA